MRLHHIAESTACTCETVNVQHTPLVLESPCTPRPVSAIG